MRNFGYDINDLQVVNTSMNISLPQFNNESTINKQNHTDSRVQSDAVIMKCGNESPTNLSMESFEVAIPKNEDSKPNWDLLVGDSINLSKE